MNVKDLAWVDEENNWYSAKVEGFPVYYEVRKTDRGSVRVRLCSANGWEEFGGNLDEAMKFCQSDYKMRVLSCLE